VLLPFHLAESRKKKGIKIFAYYILYYITQAEYVIWMIVKE
jgi:hypothetical protein